jgi:hypothetical protein
MSAEAVDESAVPASVVLATTTRAWPMEPDASLTRADVSRRKRNGKMKLLLRCLLGFASVTLLFS